MSSQSRERRPIRAYIYPILEWFWETLVTGVGRVGWGWGSFPLRQGGIPCKIFETRWGATIFNSPQCNFIFYIGISMWCLS